MLEYVKTAIIHFLFTVTCCCQTVERVVAVFSLVRRNCSKEIASKLEGEGALVTVLFIQSKSTPGNSPFQKLGQCGHPNFDDSGS